ncbi:GMC oxidoreductase [Xylariaceae sp. FL0255]|nr:GMC oxidoreductase [Xylariaceae sp. FL0255]
MAESQPWDYIIVGGGIAGCVVASRLKLYLPSSRICVIEAGPDVSDNKDILQFSSLKFIGGQFDWGYKSILQKHCNTRSIDIPSGRAVGGGSVINACGWLRGSRADYDNINAGTNLGLGELNENGLKGARQITPSVYPLDGITVKTDTLVQCRCIILDKLHARATGVACHDGTYRTPQLLMLSGIRPKEALKKHGIEMKIENRDVGTNFNDYIKLYLNWRLKDPSKAAALMETFVLYLAVPPVAINGTHISNTIIAYKPTSRETVSIASKDPRDPLLIDPNYLATEVDRTVWRESLRTIARLMSSNETALGQIVSDETPFPGFEEQIRPDSTDEYLDERIRAKTGITNLGDIGVDFYRDNGSNSCSMGKVVNTDLTVKGVQDLYIVDASVFPISTGAHIQATVYALAEQAAVIISGKE